MKNKLFFSTKKIAATKQNARRLFLVVLKELRRRRR